MSLAWVLPQIALVDGGVLRVDWNKLARLRQRHKQVATDDEGLLVGKGKALIRGQGRMARLETGGAHNSNEHAVDIVATRELANRLRANAELRSLGQLLQHGVIAVSDIGHGNGRDRKLAGGGNELRGAGVNGQCRHLQSIGMLTAYIECLRADRARTAQNGNAKASIGAIRRLE